MNPLQKSCGNEIKREIQRICNPVDGLSSIMPPLPHLLLPILNRLHVPASASASPSPHPLTQYSTCLSLSAPLTKPLHASLARRNRSLIGSIRCALRRPNTIQNLFQHPRRRSCFDLEVFPGKDHCVRRSSTGLEEDVITAPAPLTPNRPYTPASASASPFPRFTFHSSLPLKCNRQSQIRNQGQLVHASLFRVAPVVIHI